jgi:hypothetical protein
MQLQTKLAADFAQENGHMSTKEQADTLEKARLAAFGGQGSSESLRQFPLCLAVCRPRPGVRIVGGQAASCIRHRRAGAEVSCYPQNNRQPQR